MKFGGTNLIGVKKSTSMTVINATELSDYDNKSPPSTITSIHRPPRMSTLQTLEAKMANIEESLSTSMTPRRRKGTSLGNVSTRSSPKLDVILSGKDNTNFAAQQSKDLTNQRIVEELSSTRGGSETISSTSNSTVQISLDKHQQQHQQQQQISRDERVLSTTEQKLNRLRNEAENKRNAIRNLKSALQKIESNGTLDIDSRIRQAELEYALGREELQLLSIVEDLRAAQNRLEKEKTKNDTVSIFSHIKNGHQMTLHAIQASTGRWNASQRHDGGDGFFVDWVMDGEELLRGDRILEVNGKILNGRQKDELQKMCANTNKCDLVVIRKKSISMINVNPQNTPTPHYHHQLQQTQADNMRLQHRISYLEEQVKELLVVQKEKSSPTMSNGSSSGSRSGTHVTSISISSSPSAGEDEDKPMIYQRGAYITTIVGGKPQDPPTKIITASIQKSSSTNNINGHHHQPNSQNNINSQGTTSTQRESVEKVVTTPKNTPSKSLSTSMSRISISTDLHIQKQRRERERKEREKYYNNRNLMKTSAMNKSSAIAASMSHIETSYSNSSRHQQPHPLRHKRSSASVHDERSIKSLDFESDSCRTINTNYDDYASEPVPAPKIRPTPPKKPLRLSLQRATSLQVVNIQADNHIHPLGPPSPLTDIANSTLSAGDKKRAIKRLHRNELMKSHSHSMKLDSKYSEKFV